MRPPKLESFRAIEALPSLPVQMLDIIDRLSGISSMDYNIVEMIQYDPAIACRVLRTANSALYGYAGRVFSLQQASGLLGPAAIKNIIVTTPVFEKFARDEYYEAKLDLAGFWRHAAMTAALSGVLAGRVGHRQGDECFTLGLIHGLGKLAMVLQAPAKFVAAMQLSAERQIPLHEAEKEIFVYHHGHVAAEMSSSWGFPAELTDALLCMDDDSVNVNKALQVVRTASELAAEFGYADSLGDAKPRPVPPHERLQVSAATWQDWKPDLKNAAEEVAVYIRL